MTRGEGAHRRSRCRPCRGAERPELLGKLSGWTVQNSGSCGREIPRRVVVFPETSDLLIVMLGTNDLLQGATAEEAGERMRHFLSGQDRERLLLLAPPPMAAGEWVSSDSLLRESRHLSRVYRELAGEMGIRFLDTAPWNIPMAYDGVHFTEEGHRRFAEQLYRELRT